MTKSNQRTACVNAILSVLQDNGVNYELNGETPVKDVLNDSMKSQVRDLLFAAFRAGQVEYKESFQSKVDDDSELKKYISGLVNNWIRKAKEFNNGQIYKAKNPGSRAGSTDSKVKEMRKLLSVTTDPQAKAMIQQAIDSRIAEIRAEKNEVEIDYSNIPEHLREALGL
jgi:hypothetical protein